MSFFSKGLQSGLGNLLSNTLEVVGNIVAPLPDEEYEIDYSGNFEDQQYEHSPDSKNYTREIDSSHEDENDSPGVMSTQFTYIHEQTENTIDEVNNEQLGYSYDEDDGFGSILHYSRYGQVSHTPSFNYSDHRLISRTISDDNANYDQKKDVTPISHFSEINLDDSVGLTRENESRNIQVTYSNDNQTNENSIQYNNKILHSIDLSSDFPSTSSDIKNLDVDDLMQQLKDSEMEKISLNNSIRNIRENEIDLQVRLSAMEQQFHEFADLKLKEIDVLKLEIQNEKLFSMNLQEKIFSMEESKENESEEDNALKMLQDLKKEYDEFRENSLNVRNNNDEVISSLQSQIQLMKSELELKIEMIDELKLLKRNDEQNEIVAMSSSISSLNIRLEELLGELSNKDLMLQQHQLHIHELEEQNKTLITQCNELSDEVASKSSKLKEMDVLVEGSDSKIHELEDLIIRGNEEISRLAKDLIESKELIQSNDISNKLLLVDNNSIPSVTNVQDSKTEDLQTINIVNDMESKHSQEIQMYRDKMNQLKTKLLSSTDMLREIRSKITNCISFEVTSEGKNPSPLVLVDSMIKKYETLKSDFLIQYNDVQSSKALLQESQEQHISMKQEITNNTIKLEQSVHEITQLKEDVVYKDKCINELQRELQELQIQHQSCSSLIESQKQQLVKMENDIRMLQVVISQLRQVGKAKKDDLENIVIVKDEYQNKYNQLFQIHRNLEEEFTNYKQDNELMKNLRLVIENLKSDYQNEQVTHKALQQSYLSLQGQYDVISNDLSLLQTDLNHRQLEITNLHLVIKQFHKEKDISISKLIEDFHKKQLVIQEEHEKYIQSLTFQFQKNIQEKVIQIQEMNQKFNDELLLKRKLEIDFNQEKRKMQKTLNDALSQIKNSQLDVVDRTLISNLIVSYFKRKRSLDVMALIARVLSFNDEQQVAVGLKPPSINLSLSSIVTSIIGTNKAPPPDIDGDNLAELWVNFLLLETDQELANKKTVTSSPSPSPIATKKTNHSNDFTNTTNQYLISSTSSLTDGKSNTYSSLVTPPKISKMGGTLALERNSTSSSFSDISLESKSQGTGSSLLDDDEDVDAYLSSLSPASPRFLH